MAEPIPPAHTTTSLSLQKSLSSDRYIHRIPYAHQTLSWEHSIRRFELRHWESSDFAGNLQIVPLVDIQPSWTMSGEGLECFGLSPDTDSQSLPRDLTFPAHPRRRSSHGKSSTGYCPALLAHYEIR